MTRHWRLKPKPSFQLSRFYARRPSRGRKRKIHPGLWMRPWTMGEQLRVFKIFSLCQRIRIQYIFTLEMQSVIYFREPSRRIACTPIFYLPFGILVLAFVKFGMCLNKSGVLNWGWWLNLFLLTPILTLRFSQRVGIFKVTLVTLPSRWNPLLTLTHYYFGVLRAAVDATHTKMPLYFHDHSGMLKKNFSIRMILHRHIHFLVANSFLSIPLWWIIPSYQWILMRYEYLWLEKSIKVKCVNQQFTMGKDCL